MPLTPYQERQLRARLRRDLPGVLLPLPAYQGQDGEFAYVVAAPRQVRFVVAHAERKGALFSVSRVQFIKPGTVHLYLVLPADDPYARQ
jgi:hypothetical protein